MLEALLSEGGLFKKIIEAIKDLVTDANFDCATSGISLQAMDSNHVSLVSLLLRAEGFDNFRCDRNRSLGINLGAMSKVLKCAGNDDSITLKAEDGGDAVQFVFESSKQTRVSLFTLKLLDLDSEHLGIPETEYKCVIKMPASEFQRICKEIATVGDTVNISTSKEGVKFSVNGDQGTGSITCKTGDESADAEESEKIDIQLHEECSLTFALRYLNYFAKATPLSSFVTLKMSSDVPLMVEYAMETGPKDEKKALGFIRFYLAPKIEDESEQSGATGEEAADAKSDKKEKSAKGGSKKKVKKEKESEEGAAADEEGGAKVKTETGDDDEVMVKAEKVKPDEGDA